MKAWTLAAALILTATPALADRAGAERCAAGLQPLGQQLFTRALPGVLGGASIPDALRNAAVSMVMSGAISRDAARQAAESAGPCLAMARPGGG
ncbi:hypothetical protein KTR66_03560 [Roseococcus sp. SDR]|uniref:hypothetical protein n=1 Tax=Roseococcus sp. SDR TaxID=2835532 RepID=UPI001BCBC5EF|nr:hypothetical protein [Roseococcus sp. SDR]MBS7789056.1 hypothetical protein [Roseococcus sp. SDR]MBV1844370.1 hypothetical protein [Roseococcus sp. SDR]